MRKLTQKQKDILNALEPKRDPKTGRFDAPYPASYIAKNLNRTLRNVVRTLRFMENKGVVIIENKMVNCGSQANDFGNGERVLRCYWDARKYEKHHSMVYGDIKPDNINLCNEKPHFKRLSDSIK